MSGFLHILLTTIGLKKDCSHVILPPESERWEHVEHLRHLLALLLADGERTFHPVVAAATDHLVASIKSPERALEEFAEARDLYNGMWGGMGSMSDFYFVNGSAEDQAQRSARFDVVVGQLGSFFSQDQTD
tara:strand:- start:518 stop:910 length:393 start_codon:yes stop_codon:yes gene_type:complete